MPFGKRTPAQKPKTSPKETSPQTAAVADAHSSQSSRSDVMAVVIPKSAIESGAKEPWKVVSAVVDYVNTMTSRGLYQRDDLSPQAMQAYHADYYLAQVNNGGHSQFIHNSGENQDYVFNDAADGLRAMGAGTHRAVLVQLMDWVKNNPDTSRQQTGFEGGRDPFLDQLDETFYAAENKTPMADLSATWIRSWPELRVVADSDFSDAIKDLCLDNPNREKRLIRHRVLQIHHWMTDPLHVALGVAATAAEPVECLVNIRNAWGGDNAEIDGVEHRVWTLETTAGPRFGIVANDWSALFERLEHNNPEMPSIDDREGWSAAIRDGRLSEIKPPSRGAKLSQVSIEDSYKVIQLAHQTNAAAAADLLLRQSDIKAENWVLSARPVAQNEQTDTLMNWLFLTEGKAYQIIIFPDSAGIRELGGAPLARVSLAEAEAHWSITES